MDALLNALAEAMVPRGGAFDLGGGDVGLPDRLRDMTRRLGYPTWPLRLFLRFFDGLPLLFGFRLSRFSSFWLASKSAAAWSGWGSFSPQRPS
jgi:hypothetical protein